MANQALPSASPACGLECEEMVAAELPASGAVCGTFLVPPALRWEVLGMVTQLSSCAAPKTFNLKNAWSEIGVERNSAKT